MARTESKTPIWGVIAVLALLAVGANFLLRILSDPASGMDFSIYRLGAMTIFDNEGFTQDLYWSSPVEWCNRFVSFGLGYALSWSGGSSCPVGCGVSRDLVRMSRLR